MNNNLQVLAFNLTRKSDIEGSLKFSCNVLEDRDLDKTDEFKSEIIDKLNDMSTDIAHKFSQEIKDIFPEDLEVKVQKNIQFRKGSIIIDIVLVIGSWAGPIILSTLESTLKSFVELTAKNSISSFFSLAKISVVDYLKEAANKEVAKDKGKDVVIEVSEEPTIGPLRIKSMSSHSGSSQINNDGIQHLNENHPEPSNKYFDLNSRQIIFTRYILYLVAFLQVLTLFSQFFDISIDVRQKRQNTQPENTISLSL